MLAAVQALDKGSAIQTAIDYLAPAYEMEINPGRKRSEGGDESGR
jgi:hypothetical protein